jgi:hypothetical protein
MGARDWLGHRLIWVIYECNTHPQRRAYLGCSVFGLAASRTGAFYETIGFDFGNVVPIKAGLRHRTIP